MADLVPHLLRVDVRLTYPVAIAQIAQTGITYFLFKLSRSLLPENIPGVDQTLCQSCPAALIAAIINNS